MRPLRLKDLLPWRAFTIDTTWPAPVAAIEIRKRLAPRSPWQFLSLSGGGSPDQPFVGKEEGDSFVFSRAIGYRNSFLPVIGLTIAPSGDTGARVNVRMRMNAAVVAFMAVWMTGATLGALSLGAVAIVEGRPAGLLALLFPLFGGLLAGGGFAFEARRAESLLRDLFPPPPPPPPEPLGPYR